MTRQNFLIKLKLYDLKDKTVKAHENNGEENDTLS